MEKLPQSKQKRFGSADVGSAGTSGPSLDILGFGPAAAKERKLSAVIGLPAKIRRACSAGRTSVQLETRSPRAACCRAPRRPDTKSRNLDLNSYHPRSRSAFSISDSLPATSNSSFKSKPAETPSLMSRSRLGEHLLTSIMSPSPIFGIPGFEITAHLVLQDEWYCPEPHRRTRSPNWKFSGAGPGDINEVARLDT